MKRTVMEIATNLGCSWNIHVMEIVWMSVNNCTPCLILRLLNRAM